MNTQDFLESHLLVLAALNLLHGTPEELSDHGIVYLSSFFAATFNLNVRFWSWQDYKIALAERWSQLLLCD